MDVIAGSMRVISEPIRNRLTLVTTIGKMQVLKEGIVPNEPIYHWVRFPVDCVRGVVVVV